MVDVLPVEAAALLGSAPVRSCPAPAASQRLFASGWATMRVKLPHGLIITSPGNSPLPWLGCEGGCQRASLQKETRKGKTSRLTSFLSMPLHKIMDNEPARTLPCTQPTLINVRRDNPI